MFSQIRIYSHRKCTPSIINLEKRILNELENQFKKSDMEIHHKAIQQFIFKINYISIQILNSAKFYAQSDNSETILNKHVIKASESLFYSKKKSQVRKFLLIIGSTCLGAFITGIIPSINQNNQFEIIIWISLGMIGLTCVFCGLR